MVKVVNQYIYVHVSRFLFFPRLSLLFSSPEPKAHKVSIYSIPIEPLSICVCVCVCLSTLSNMNISATRGPNATKFYLKHHWGEGMAALRFGPDQIRTMVSMATDSSHRVIMETMLTL